MEGRIYHVYDGFNGEFYNANEFELLRAINGGSPLIVSRENLPTWLNLKKNNGKLQDESNRYREALKEIRKGDGAYDLDKLKHASNCIENMKNIADKALK